MNVIAYLKDHLSKTGTYFQRMSRILARSKKTQGQHNVVYKTKFKYIFIGSLNDTSDCMLRAYKLT